MSLERSGIPTATFITHAFANYARGLCRMQGLEALPSIVIPHPIASRPTEELRRESLLGELRQRIREVRQGPDGLLYLLTDEDDGAMLRIEPVP